MRVVLTALFFISAVQAGCKVTQDLGCYDDHGRILSEDPFADWHQMTIESCAQVCQDNNMTYAGVEYSTQCFCGNKIKDGAKKIDPSNCGSKCPGNNKEDCGGNYAVDVFTFSCSGKPEPTPGNLPVYPSVQPCKSEPLKSAKVCDTSASLEDRVQDIVNRISAADVPSLLSNKAGGVDNLNLPFYNWWSEALHGVSRCPYGGSGCCYINPATGNKTCPSSFPAAITSSCSFNNTLFNLIGTAVGTEARVMSNKGIASLTFWTPNVNIFRDPRWGRGQETPGEDPTLNSNYAEYFVSGFQTGEDPSRLKASACCKHFAGYSLENWNGVDRHHFNAIITQQDLQDTYFPAFTSCANRGNASGLMCSYNAVNGVPSCASQDLLVKNLRQKWKFNGYITSDCGAVSNIQNQHQYTNNSDDTCKDALEAGTDSDCGGFYQGSLGKAISDKSVSQELYQQALANLFRVQLRLGYFDPDDNNPYRQYDLDKVDTPQHRQLTLEAARQGMVLVKNIQNTLPFKKNEIKTVAMVGPNADATTVMQSNYHGTAPFLISPSDGVSNYANVTVEHGCSINTTDTKDIPNAVKASQEADATVIILGLDTSLEGEGHDRNDIRIPGCQFPLLKQVAEASKGPVVLVIMSGGPIDVTWAKNSDKIGAILIVGYPGESGGQAIAETLFGDNNPSGKLTQTWYPAEFTDQVSMFNMNMRPNASANYPGRTFRFYTGTPVFKFGEGMSYTSFDHKLVSDSVISLSHSTLQAHIEATDATPHLAPKLFKVQIEVTNTGNMTGADIILAMVIPPKHLQQTIGAPRQQLRNYERVNLHSGERKTVELSFNAHDFGLVDDHGLPQAFEGAWTMEIGDEEVTVLIS